MTSFGDFVRILENSEVEDGLLARRDALLSELRAKFPGEFLKTSEEFSSSITGGVWITGKKMADYYGKDNTGFDYWVNPKLQRILAKHKFWLQPWDSETWLAYSD